MKLKSLLFGSAVASVVLIVFPILFVWINNMLGLPVINNIAFLTIGLVFAVIGCGLFIYCTLIFKKIGKGTPIPLEPPKKFVYTGVYSHVRNPIYVGYAIIFMSYFLIFGHLALLLYTIIGTLFLHFYVVLFEEKNLKKRFGKTYEIYLKKVPRWLPRFNAKKTRIL